ncbi:MAG: AAA family ATPase [Dysgonomonas sp.]|uniref:AAA family ATPase n=1 Tax=Dysgonomonas sp. TaxID=1891233 RepID=UPI0033904A4A|nr:AAA family ATPase [Dysgonomonas sp.]
MELTNVKISSFRSLESINLNVEEDITLIVEKNNTEKTSLFESINIFISESSRRKLSLKHFNEIESLLGFNLIDC